MTWLATLILLGAVAMQDSATVRIWFLDVGQGDAAVIRSPGGRTVMIDGGRSARRVLPMLDALGVDTIDLMVASHAHADHIGGLDAVLLSRPVRYFLDNGRPYTTATYRSLMHVVESSNVTYLEATPRTIALDSVTLRVLPPPPGEESQNNSSVGLVFEHGGFRALFVGDAEQPELNHFLGVGVPRIAVLKASHHGARNGLTPGWVYATRPRVVVISVGRNSYGHPDPTALRYYEAYAEAIYRTDQHGTVMVEGRRDGSFEVTHRDRHGVEHTMSFAAVRP
jgi:beta-lactamase superfamily II metal-dependent hydrolase